MYRYFSLTLFLISLFLLSCKGEQKTVVEETVTSDMSVVSKHSKPSNLSDLAKSKIQDWTEYNEINDFLDRFSSISPNQALQMANELTTLAKNLNDSLKIETLKTNALKARTNVLENEVLRLNDMTMIPAIKAKEVNEQIDKILLIFGSYNAKVNTIYSKKEFDEEINLDDFFKLDTETETKTKTIPKKE
ncbi:hypothetical protein [uncultured Tenacibaculum sp.]|uniref:hypothetical protein n=1 Tax=uncultured Tenacibaculum sp. TaxID=174713 RepID=UPI002609D6B0|nr:hypothetical protein [uncultured Tenacibaculum sp.]